ncbi:Uncharacterized protein DAT39_001379, partial [Clarias magur]
MRSVKLLHCLKNRPRVFVHGIPKTSKSLAVSVCIALGTLFIFRVAAGVLRSVSPRSRVRSSMRSQIPTPPPPSPKLIRTGHVKPRTHDWKANR